MDFWKLFEAWLVAEENHLYVLGVYGLIFGIMLPAAVGSWWYRSIQYTGDSVLIKTTKMFEVRFYNCNDLEIFISILDIDRPRVIFSTFSGKWDFLDKMLFFQKKNEALKALKITDQYLLN